MTQISGKSASVSGRQVIILPKLNTTGNFKKLYAFLRRSFLKDYQINLFFVGQLHFSSQE
jgi:hypothetical protein